MAVVLPAVQPWLGMPLHVFPILCCWALGCLAFDVYSYGFADLTHPRWLKTIMFANTTYCLLTAGLLVRHFADLTPLGVVYFIGEMPVIIGLVYLEYRLYRAWPSP